MKKVFLSLVMLCGATMAFAAEEKLFELYQDGNKEISGSTYYVIDRDAKTFRFDSDSEDEAQMIIKNYKKSGDKESFDLYPKVTPTQKHCSATIAPNSEGKPVLSIKYSNYTRSYVVGDENEKKAYIKGKKGAQSSTSATPTKESATESVTDKAKSTAKGLLNKGKGLIKKK